jgi:hypothetical protein
VSWDDVQEKQKHLYTRGQLVYDGHIGLLAGTLQAGEKRLVCVDRY